MEEYECDVQIEVRPGVYRKCGKRFKKKTDFLFHIKYDHGLEM